MKVGDLVRNKSNWGPKVDLGLIVKVHYEYRSLGTEKTQIVTLYNGWEYLAKELEVISNASR